MASEEIPEGQRFTHVYLERGAPIQDSPRFRKRIGSRFQSLLDENLNNSSRLRDYDAARFFKDEMGLDAWSGSGYNFESFFEGLKIHDLCDAITIAWRYFGESADIRVAITWRDFVKRALKEENMGYYLDDECGVHYLVDEEFERNRASALRCLGNAKYSGVRTAFEHAFEELDANPPHAKDAVRAIFESVEILVKQMVKTENLNDRVVKNSLKEKALNAYESDPTAKESIGKMFEGFAQWVNSIHLYRHGQAGPEPVEPSLEFAVYAVSSGAAFLRWLIDIDSKNDKA